MKLVQQVQKALKVQKVSREFRAKLELKVKQVLKVNKDHRVKLVSKDRKVFQ